jgi:hypothetical protein
LIWFLLGRLITRFPGVRISYKWHLPLSLVLRLKSRWLFSCTLKF